MCGFLFIIVFVPLLFFQPSAAYPQMNWHHFLLFSFELPRAKNENIHSWTNLGPVNPINIKKVPACWLPPFIVWTGNNQNMVGNVYCFPWYFVCMHARGNHKTRFMIYIPFQNCFGNDNAFADTVIFTNLCHMIKEVVMIFKTYLQTTVVTYRQFFVTCIKHRNGFMIKTKKYRFIERHLGGVWEYDIYEFPYGKNFWSALVMIRYSDQSITRAVSIISGN